MKDFDDRGPHPGDVKFSGPLFATGVVHGNLIAAVDAPGGVVLVKLRTEVHVKEATSASATPTRWHRGDAVGHLGAAR